MYLLMWSIIDYLLFIIKLLLKLNDYIIDYLLFIIKLIFTLNDYSSLIIY